MSNRSRSEIVRNLYLAVSAFGEGCDYAFLYKGSAANSVFRFNLNLSIKEKRVLYREVRLLLRIRIDALRAYRISRTFSEEDIAKTLRDTFSRLGQLGFMYSVFKMVYHFLHYKDGSVAGGHGNGYAFRTLVPVIKNKMAIFAAKLDGLGEQNIKMYGRKLGQKFTLDEWTQLKFDFVPKFQEFVSKEHDIISLEMAAYAADLSYYRMRIMGFGTQVSQDPMAYSKLELLREGIRQDVEDYAQRDLKHFTVPFCAMYMERVSSKPLISSEYGQSKHYLSLIHRELSKKIISKYELDSPGKEDEFAVLERLLEHAVQVVPRKERYPEKVPDSSDDDDSWP